MSVKLTKNEQKKQKDSLRQYERYLPTLQLKKKQLQSVIKDYQEKAVAKRKERETLRKSIEAWQRVFGENRKLKDGGVASLVVKKEVECTFCNVAGVNVPVFGRLTFEDIRYDVRAYPLWVDRAVEALKAIVSLDAETLVLERAVSLLEKELKTTTQRVNLFEKVKIPETKENIRKIQVALQDQQTASVVRGKIAKKKLQAEGGR